MDRHTYRIFYTEFPPTKSYPDGIVMNQEQKEMALAGFATPLLANYLRKVDKEAKIDPPNKINSDMYAFTIHTQLEKNKIDEMVKNCAEDLRLQVQLPFSE